MQKCHLLGNLKSNIEIYIISVEKSIGFVGFFGFFGFFALKSEDFFRWLGFRPEVGDPLKAIQGSHKQ